MKKYFGFIVLFFALSMSYAQNKKDVLLTIDDKPVYISEFKRVFNKNLDLVKDENQKSVDGYLDLFIDYKLKVAEAYNEGLDKEKRYVVEFDKYQSQLARGYIFEDKLTKELAEEAYERSLEEINANHILILATYDDTPQDTLKAYNKIKKIYDRAKAGEDFETLAKENSEEPNASKSAGSLGYFSAFSMVYPFETMAYNTKVGEVSEIVRTQFGYHIIKVNDRRERATPIVVSHLMIADNGNDRTFDPEERINEIKALLAQGESFESLAKQYSDDKNSAKHGGQLNAFRKGQLRAPKFEDAAYKLKNVGDISEPIKSKFGWHLIRLDEIKTTPTFEEEEESLLKQVKSGIRSKIVSSAIGAKIKDKYDFKVVNDYIPFFDTYVDDAVLKRRWRYDTIPASEDKVIFTIESKEVTFNDFAAYINNRQRSPTSFKTKMNVLTSFYDEFETEELKDFYKENLEFENEEYAATLNEYRNGLLIFDVMNRNIWEKAKKDTVGLENYYEGHKQNYIWNERVQATLISTSSSDVATQVEALLKDGKTSEEIKKAVNTNDTVNVIISEGDFEKGQRELPADFEFTEGVSKVYNHNEGFVVVDVKKVLPEGIKSLNMIKGKVMSDYQTFLEKKWMDSLRAKYNVEIHKKALKRLKKELDS